MPETLSFRVKKMCDKNCATFDPEISITDCTFTSEYRNEFKKTPYTSYKDQFEVPVPCSRFVLPQELYERGNQLLPRYSQCTSTYRSDYRPCDRPKFRPKTSGIILSRPNHQLIDIDVTNCGYKKYLDIYATTKVLDHRHFSPDEVKHDAITTWDWLQMPKTRGRTIPLDVPISQRDLRPKSKLNQHKQSEFVPNRGLLSEYQEEFIHQN